MRFFLSTTTALILGAFPCTGNLAETAITSPRSGSGEQRLTSQHSLEKMLSSSDSTRRDVHLVDIVSQQQAPSLDGLAEKMKTYHNNVQNTKDRDLQSGDTVLYGASFFTLTQYCGAFTPLLQFGCTSGGLLTIIDVSSTTGFSPVCAEHPTLGSSYSLCAVGYDTDTAIGTITDTLIGFTCTGSSDSQRIGEALHDSHAPVCLTDFGENLAGNTVSLAYYNSFQEGFDQDIVCLLGSTEVLDSGQVICLSADSCSIGTTCSTFLPAVHVIQSTPLASGAIFVPPPDSPTPPAPTPPAPTPPAPTPRPPPPPPTPFPTNRPAPVSGPTPFPTDKPPTPFPTESPPSGGGGGGGGGLNQAGEAPTPTFGGNSNPIAPSFQQTFQGAPSESDGFKTYGQLIVLGVTTLLAMMMAGL